MNTTQREPVLFAGFVAAALTLLVLYGVLDAQKAAGWQALAVAAIPLVQFAASWWARGRVFSPNTIRQAGLDPEAVQADADDPDVVPFPGPSR